MGKISICACYNSLAIVKILEKLKAFKIRWYVMNYIEIKFINAMRGG